MSTRQVEELGHYLQRLPPHLLWHYTNLEGLQGILAEGAIWAADVRYLNDRREHVHARELFIEILTDKRDKASGSESLMLEQALNLFQTVHTLENYRVFVSSFSENEDQLSQWRAYGPTAKGVSIGFDLRSLAIPELDISSSVFAPCVYSRQRQIEMVRLWLKQYTSSWQRMVEANAKGSFARLEQDDPVDVFLEKFVDAYGADLCMEFIGSLLDAGRLCALLKHESFSEEDEWRLVITESRALVSPSPHKLRVRVGSSTFVPYISIPITPSSSESTGESKIKAITVGPHPDPQRALTAMDEFLVSNGLAGIKVEASRIPFRTW